MAEDKVKRVRAIMPMIKYTYTSTWPECLRLRDEARAKSPSERGVCACRAKIAERLTRRIANAILMLSIIINVKDRSCDGFKNEHSRCDVICQKCGDESMRVGRRHMVLSGRSPYGLSL